MIDIKVLRENPEAVKENIKKKFQDHKLHLVDEVIELDQKNRQAILKGDELRKRRNELSSQIGNLMKNGQKEEANKIKEQVSKINDELTQNEQLEANFAEEIKNSSTAPEIAIALLELRGANTKNKNTIKSIITP